MKIKLSIVFTVLAIIVALLPVFFPSLAVAGPVTVAILSCASLAFSIFESREATKEMEALKQEVKDNKPVYYVEGDTLVLGTAKSERERKMDKS